METPVFRMGIQLLMMKKIKLRTLQLPYTLGVDHLHGHGKDQQLIYPGSIANMDLL